MVDPLILASSSMVRHNLLKQAGVAHEVVVSYVDEDAIKTACWRDGFEARDTAAYLARAKAEAVAKERPRALVIGADKILECNGQWFDKPPDLLTARRHLEQLRGQTHHLASSTVVWADGVIVWCHQELIAMSMRPLTDEFIEHYIGMIGEAACYSVGAYQLEGLGAQLFESTTGDFFSILGLPLLPLMAFLRQRGLVAE